MTSHEPSEFGFAPTESSASGATSDTTVSQSQFNQAFQQLARMQQETMQGLHQMQAQFQEWTSPCISGCSIGCWRGMLAQVVERGKSLLEGSNRSEEVWIVVLRPCRVGVLDSQSWQAQSAHTVVTVVHTVKMRPMRVRCSDKLSYGLSPFCHSIDYYLFIPTLPHR